MTRNRPSRSIVRPIVIAGLALVTVLAGTAATRLAGVGPAEAQRSSSRDVRGFLGVRLQDLDDGLRKSYDFEGGGVLVSDVTPGSPAAAVGIEDGDILVKLDDRAVSSAEQVTGLVQGMRPGTLVGVWVVRDGKTRYLGRAEIADLRATLGDDAPGPVRTPRARRAPRAVPAPDAAPSPGAPGDGPGIVREFKLGPGMSALMGDGRGRLGVQPHDLDADLGAYFQVPDGRGVLVLRVLEDTPAAAAGLRSGDVIRRVGGTKVDDTEELRRALGDRKAGRVDVEVLRKGAARTIAVDLKEAESLDLHALPGHGDWMGWMERDGDDGEKDGGEVRKHVLRFRGDRPGDMRFQVDGHDVLSREERERLEADMKQLREDLKDLRRELRQLRDSRGR